MVARTASYTPIYRIARSIMYEWKECPYSAREHASADRMAVLAYNLHTARLRGAWRRALDRPMSHVDADMGYELQERMRAHPTTRDPQARNQFVLWHAEQEITCSDDPLARRL